MGSPLSGVDPDYQIGRVVSQIAARSIPANSNCTWAFGVPGCLEQKERIRLRFNSPLDLEPQPVSAIGDKIVVAAQGNMVTEIFVEKCDTDDVCSYPWQVIFNSSEFEFLLTPSHRIPCCFVLVHAPLDREM